MDPVPAAGYAYGTPRRALRDQEGHWEEPVGLDCPLIPETQAGIDRGDAASRDSSRSANNQYLVAEKARARCRLGRRIQPTASESKPPPMKRIYVRRGLRLDGSSYWCVINCHTRRLASKAKFESRSAAEARRAQLQGQVRAASRAAIPLMGREMTRPRGPKNAGRSGAKVAPA